MPDFSPPPQAAIPEPLTRELPAHEAVLRVAEVVCAPTAQGSTGLEGTAVLTSDRLVFVPGASKKPTAGPASPLAELLRDLWSHVRPVLLSAFPMTQIVSKVVAPKTHLAARARPGVEIPLAMIQRAFESTPLDGFGIELALPPSDPRPPFALYFRVRTDSDPAGPRAGSEWARAIEIERKHAHLLPELERPYALYYLLRDPPRPEVRVHGSGFSDDGSRPPLPSRGLLTLTADGLAIGKKKEAWMHYEAITELAWSEGTSFRAPRLRIAAGERAWWLDPRRAYDVRLLSDTARLLSELTSLPLQSTPGPIRKGRVMGWIAAAGSGGAVTAYEVLHQLLHWL